MISVLRSNPRMKLLFCSAALSCLISLQALPLEEMENSSGYLVPLEYYDTKELYHHPINFDRMTRSNEKFSRIMRSDKFARIVRDHSKLLRILRSGDNYLRDSDNSPISESRVIRSPEIKFTRILRSGAESNGDLE